MSLVRKFIQQFERNNPERSGKKTESFSALGLDQNILRALTEEGYKQPTPIQQSAIGEIMKGRDLLGCAQTGTGKTAAFALPTLHRLSQERPKHRAIRALILAPTRELALQIHESYEKYGRYLDLNCEIVFGGVSIRPQKQALKKLPDILVATPGRLLDLAEQGCVRFDRLEVLVLDEADRMLDMGFLPEVKRVLKLLRKQRQNILLSATIPDAIDSLSMKLLSDPVKVEVAPVSSASDQVEQSLYYVSRRNKRKLLLKLLEDDAATRVLVFTRTKAIANRIAKLLNDQSVSAEAIHGNKSQTARQRALANFKDGSTRVLVASDLAARGLDVDYISHVINFDMPNIPETYVHRIGRTGRASAVGRAISLCDAQEQAYVRDIEQVIGKEIPVVTDHEYELTQAELEEGKIAGPPQQGGGRSNSRNRGQRGRGRAASGRSGENKPASKSRPKRKPSSKKKTSSGPSKKSGEKKTARPQADGQRKKQSKKTARSGPKGKPSSGSRRRGPRRPS